jgi:hypothetical protein
VQDTVEAAEAVEEEDEMRISDSDSDSSDSSEEAPSGRGRKVVRTAPRPRSSSHEVQRNNEVVKKGPKSFTSFFGRSAHVSEVVEVGSSDSSSGTSCE